MRSLDYEAFALVGLEAYSGERMEVLIASRDVTQCHVTACFGHSVGGVGFEVAGGKLLLGFGIECAAAHD